MSRKLIIAIDCDDVLIETTPFIVDAYNKKFGTHVTLARAYEQNNPEWECSNRHTLWERFSDLEHLPEFTSLEPIDDAIIAVRQLAVKHELHLITARPQSSEVITMAMLDNYLASCFQSVEHVGHDRSKGEICAQIGADVLIDDNMKHLVSALEHGVPANGALHFGDYPWNKQENLPDGVVKCLNWKQIMNEVTKIAG